MSNLSELWELVTIHADSAAEFMRNLDETCYRWGKTEYWIFRGQNNACWELLPSLFRRWNPDTEAGYEISLVENFIRQVRFRIPLPCLDSNA